MSLFISIFVFFTVAFLFVGALWGAYKLIRYCFKRSTAVGSLVLICFFVTAGFIQKLAFENEHLLGSIEYSESLGFHVNTKSSGNHYDFISREAIEARKK